GNGGDTITGTSGANNIQTGLGNDILKGGGGNDTMLGGAGDDIYTVNAAGDVVTETAGQGSEAAKSSITYTLVPDVENLTLTGANHINGTGNSAANVLTGNSGVNVLSGLGGNDTMIWSSADTYDGGADTDTLKVISGNLNLTTIDDARILNVET